MQLHIEYSRIKLYTAFHQQFKCFSDEYRLPKVHSVFQHCSECPPAAATHDQSLLQNDTIVLSMNSCGKFLERRSLSA